MVEVIQVPPGELEDSPLNPRKTYNLTKISELAETIRRVGWVGQLLGRRVDGLVELVYGHRRKRAAIEAELEAIPVELRDLTDEEVIAIQMAENVAREDMTPLEEGDGFAAWKRTGASVEDMAAEVGRPVSFVRQRLQLAALPGAVRGALARGTIGVGHALLIGGLPPEQQQDAALEHVVETIDAHGECTVRDLASWVRWKARDLADAPWKLDDAQLVLSAPACAKCTKRTGATADLFPGVTEDRCLDAECWSMKLEAHQREQKRMAPPAAPAPAKKGRELPAAAPAPSPAPNAPVRETVNRPQATRGDQASLVRAILDDLLVDDDGLLSVGDMRLVVDELASVTVRQELELVTLGLDLPATVVDHPAELETLARHDLARMAVGLAIVGRPLHELEARAESMGIELVDPPPPAKKAPAKPAKAAKKKGPAKAPAKKAKAKGRR